MFAKSTLYSSIFDVDVHGWYSRSANAAVVIVFVVLEVEAMVDNVDVYVDVDVTALTVVCGVFLERPIGKNDDQEASRLVPVGCVQVRVV